MLHYSIYLRRARGLAAPFFPSLGSPEEKDAKERHFSYGRGQEDEPSETAIIQKEQQSLPKPTELGLCPEGGLPAAGQWPYSFWLHNDFKTNQDPKPEAGDKHKYLVGRANI